MACELCDQVGGALLWRDELCRVVQVNEPAYPGFCRVIWQAHSKEMGDLSSAQRQHLMRVVFAVEQALSKLMRPDKINLASLGNLTPHVHWHIIPRFHDDAHFPQAIWSAPLRVNTPPPAPSLNDLRITLDELLQTPYD